jgi:hypothetical protein
MILFLFAVGIAVHATSISGGNVDGNWAGDIPAPNGNSLTVVFTFKTDGEKLKGSVFAVGKDFPLAEGSIKGDTIAFRIEGDTPYYTGHIIADTIDMKQTWKGGENGTRVFTFTLKRKKD